MDSISRRSWITTILASSTALALTSDWKPAFLTPREDATLVKIGDRIIPGSAAANCNRVIDLILNIETPETQKEFRAALKIFLDAGLDTKSPQEQDAFLTTVSTSGRAQEHAFLYVKEWLADTYWSSAAGWKELGFDGNMAWPDYNPCPHPAA